MLVDLRVHALCGCWSACWLLTCFFVVPLSRGTTMKIIELLVRMNYIWVVLSAVYHSVVWMMPQYSAAELIQLRLRPFNPPSTLHLPSDIVFIPRRKYIHRGSRRSYNIDGSSQIRSFWSSKPAVFNSSPRAPPLCTFCMFLSSLQTFVLFDRKCPAKWTSQDIPPSFQFEASVYVPFKGH